MARKQQVIHINSSIKDKLPGKGVLANGEIAVNFNEEHPFIAILKNGEDGDNVTDYAKFSSDEYWTEIIEENEEVTAHGLNALNERADEIEEFVAGSLNAINDTVEGINQTLNSKVSGPSSASNGGIVLFDGTTGKLIKDSKVALPSNPKFTDTTYTAGTNITIDSNNKISATDTKYTAGTNITIDSSNKISATDTKYTAGTNITIDSGNKISATDTKYSNGDGLLLNGTVFSHADTNPNINSDTSYGPDANVTQSAKNPATFKVPQITLDKFGHVKLVSERTITVTDTDTKIELDNTVTSTSTTKGATANAVKTAYDKANAALPKAGGTMTGTITSQNITPSSHNTYNLGTSDNRYKEVNVSQKVNLGTSSIFYNNVTGCLEILA